MAGPILGRYRLLARVAAGPAGEIWRGVDVGVGGIERPVAVRLLAGPLGDEARRAFALCHQNVVQVRDAGEIDGRPLVAMEWVDGADLATILQRLRASAGQPLPLRFACLVGVEAARGLDYAHRAGLVHRALAPASLLASIEGELKVADFGLGRRREAYLAPEQAGGDAGVDARADVFALGAVLYEAVSAQPPAAGRPAPLRTLSPTVPQGLEAIVLRAMAPARDQRYQTAAQMREDLEALARRESYALSPSDFGQFVRDLVEAPAAAAAAPAAAPRRLSASRAVASPRAFGAALGGALAALGHEEDEAAEAPARPATVAVPEVQAYATIAPPAEDERPKPPTDLTDMIPRERPWPRWLGAIALLAVLGGGAAWYVVSRPANRPLVGEGSPASPSAPGTGSAAAPASGAAAASPSASGSAPGSTTAVTGGVPPSSTSTSARTVVAPPSHHRTHSGVAAHGSEAHLTITADGDAEAYVDGALVRATPIVDLSLPPGRHVVRVESTAPGLRLIPREETVELRPGELKELHMVLK